MRWALCTRRSRILSAAVGSPMGMPVGDRDLRGQNRGTGLIAVVTDLEEIAAFRIIQWRHGPVVEDQNVGEGQAAQQPAEAAVGVSQRQFAEQLSGASVVDGVAVAAGFVRQRGG